MRGVRIEAPDSLDEGAGLLRRAGPGDLRQEAAAFYQQGGRVRSACPCERNRIIVAHVCPMLKIRNVRPFQRPKGLFRTAHGYCAVFSLRVEDGRAIRGI